MKQVVNIVLFILLIFSHYACQPSGDSHVGQNFSEPHNPQAISPEQNWEKLNADVQLSWANTNKRYHKDYIPDIPQSDTVSCVAWKNERVYAQLLAWSKDSISKLSIDVSALNSSKSKIDAEAIEHFFIRNVITDEHLGGCGTKEKNPETAHLLPDLLESGSSISLQKNSLRGIWFNINVPESAEAGKYYANIQVLTSGKETKTLVLELTVLNRMLPDPSNWKFHLDLWQNPYAVARYHGIDLWSDAHFELMKPLYKMLAEAGQKCITASILDKPWGGQTYDPFASMIKHTLKENGDWEYDYSIFDTWVVFMMDLGIDKQINCYSLIPWGDQLSYFDESTGRDTLIKALPSSVEFTDYWRPFLVDFSKHLHDLGIYEITSIAMDERPLEHMLSAIELIREYSGLRISSAANYNPGLSNQVYDLSVAYEHPLSPKIISERRNKDQLTTFYVYCFNPFPNTFTFSPLSESLYLGWFAYANKLDGFLRWAYNSWVEDPINDSRFRTWPSGDTYFVYPGARSSLRFEKLREGIQDYEKLRILTEKLTAIGSNDALSELKKIQDLLLEFDASTLEGTRAEQLMLEGKSLLNNIN